jgi:methyl-accepting chemotaxis protein
VSAVNDLAIALDAERAAINALAAQFAAGFDRLEQLVGSPGHRADAGFGEMGAKLDQVDAKFDQIDAGFAEMRGRFDQIAASIQQIVDLLTRPQEK